MGIRNIFTNLANQVYGLLGLAHGGLNLDLTATGGTSQVLKQTSSGGAITVAQLAASDLSNGTSGTGAVLLQTSPSLTTPNIGVATATSIGYPSVVRTTVKLNVSSAQLLALPGTVVSLIAAPSANQLIKIESVTYQYRFLTTAYTIFNPDNTFALVYHGFTTVIESVAATGLVDQTSNQVAYNGGALVATPQVDAVQLGVDLTLTGTSPALTLGAGSLELVIAYATVNLS